MKKIYILSLLLFCSNLFAANLQSYYCSTTFKTIKLGDSLESVQSNCGAPSFTNTRQTQTSTPTTTTRWIYSLGALSIKGTGFFLPQLIITFDSNNNVSNISRGGSPITGNGYCTYNNAIQIGDPMSKVLTACGRPNYTNSNQTLSNTTQNVLEWTYNFGPYQPRIILDFQNDVLTQITSGQLGN